MIRGVRAGVAALTIGCAVVGGPPAAAQAEGPAGDSLSNAGVRRAAALVDSVFIDRLLPAATVGGGDFASYLMARLGVTPIPPDLAFRVTVDTQQLLLHGRVRDLPWATRRALSGLLAMVGPDAPVAAQVLLVEAGPRVVRFHLRAVTISGAPVPEPLLALVMGNVGIQYPELTATGRDLFVEIPANARIVLQRRTVRLVAPDTAGAVAPRPGK